MGNKNDKWFQWTFIVVSIGLCFSFVQEERLIKQLEYELFVMPSVSALVSFEDAVDCKMRKMPVEHFIRQQQPNSNQVIKILQTIALKKDPSLIREIERIYEDALTSFDKEWRLIFEQNFYVCDEARAQLSILEAFEAVLRSLRSLSIPMPSLYQLYKEESNLWHQYYYCRHGCDKSKVVDQFEGYHPRYKALKAQHWGMRDLDFTYLQPFLEDNTLEALFVADLQTFKWDTIDTSSEQLQKERFILNNIPLFAQLRSPKIDEYFQINFEHWFAHNRQAWIFNLAGDRKNKALIIYLLDQLLNNDQFSLKKMPKSHYFGALLSNSEENAALLEKELQQHVEKKHSHEKEIMAYLATIDRFKVKMENNE